MYSKPSAATGLIGSCATELGRVPSPLPLPMKRRFESGETATAVGYQPVGMKPRTRLDAGREMSTTATALLSALAT